MSSDAQPNGRRPPAATDGTAFLRFFRTESASAVLLLVAAGIAMLIVNSGWGPAYERLWQHTASIAVNVVFSDSGSRAEFLRAVALVAAVYFVFGFVAGALGPRTGWAWGLWIGIPGVVLLVGYAFVERAALLNDLLSWEPLRWRRRVSGRRWAASLAGRGAEPGGRLGRSPTRPCRRLDSTRGRRSRCSVGRRASDG